MAARTYTRDSRGRFASGGGGGGGGGGKGGGKGGAGKAKGSMDLMAARGSLRRSREKLAANPSKGQKGAVTRANKKLIEAKKAAQRTISGRSARAGVMAGTVRRDPGALQRRNAQRAEKAQSKAAQRGKQLARTSKAPENAAKARFKELSTKARRGNRYGGNFADEARAGGAAKRSLKAMVKNRGVSGKAKASAKPAKASAKPSYGRGVDAAKASRIVGRAKANQASRGGAKEKRRAATAKRAMKFLARVASSNSRSGWRIPTRQESFKALARGLNKWWR
jgi:hypothetical protein